MEAVVRQATPAVRPDDIVAALRVVAVSPTTLRSGATKRCVWRRGRSTHGRRRRSARCRSITASDVVGLPLDRQVKRLRLRARTKVRRLYRLRAAAVTLMRRAPGGRTERSEPMLEPDNPDNTRLRHRLPTPVKAPRTRSRQKTAGTAEVPQSAPNATSADSARNASSPQSAAEAPESTVSNEAPARSPRRRTARKSVDAATAADTPGSCRGHRGSVSGEPRRPGRAAPFGEEGRRRSRHARAPSDRPSRPDRRVANAVVDAIPPHDGGAQRAVRGTGERT